MSPVSFRWNRGEFEAWKERRARQAGRDRELTSTAKFALVVILWHLNRKTLAWALRVEKVAEAMGTDARHARRALAALERRGYLKRVPRPGHANLYSVPLSSSAARASLASSDGRLGAEGASA